MAPRAGIPTWSLAGVCTVAPVSSDPCGGLLILDPGRIWWMEGAEGNRCCAGSADVQLVLCPQLCVEDMGACAPLVLGMFGFQRWGWCSLKLRKTCAFFLQREDSRV